MVQRLFFAAAVLMAACSLTPLTKGSTVFPGSVVTSHSLGYGGTARVELQAINGGVLENAGLAVAIDTDSFSDPSASATASLSDNVVDGPAATATAISRVSGIFSAGGDFSAGGVGWSGSLTRTEDIPDMQFEAGVFARGRASGGFSLLFSLLPEVSQVTYIVVETSERSDGSSEGTAERFDVPVSGGFSLSLNHTVADDGYHSSTVNAEEKASLRLLYSFWDGWLPGANPSFPLPPGVFTPGEDFANTVIEDNEEDEPVGRNRTVIGINLTTVTTVPVINDDYGHSDTVYIDPALAVGYGYGLGGSNRFHTYQIPDALPQGDDTFTIVHNHIPYDLQAGEVFDFTTIDPNGVDSFLLVGIDETELIDPGGNVHPPFVYGATFMDPGIAQVTTFPLVYLDPADTDKDGDVDTADLTVMFQNFTGDGGMGKTMMDGDTDMDGDVDTADLTTGFQNFTGAQAGLASVPEPSGWLLLVLGLVGLCPLLRRRNH